MEIVIMHGTVTSHDAIGNDIELEYKILSKQFSTRVYALNELNDNVVYLSQEQLFDAISETNNLLIYHHSVYWKFGEDILDHCKCKIIFRYHNITPETFFKPYNQNAYEQCKFGREQTIRFQKKYNNSFWISDSNYNALDLALVPKERQNILAPFNKIEEWAEATEPDEAILKKLLEESPKVNILFVGRIAPNKGHRLLIKTLYEYCSHYDTDIKLRIVGKFDRGIYKYNNELIEQIHSYNLDNYVEFIGEINDSVLMSYYLGSDIMLCCSEHEGFCVPIIEAQFFHLPIIAINECAVPETIGENQIVLDRNPIELAAAIHIVSSSPDINEFLIKSGLNNYKKRFTYNSMFERFNKIIKEVIESEK